VLVQLADLRAWLAGLESRVTAKIEALDAHLTQVEAQVHVNGGALLVVKSLLESPPSYRGSVFGTLRVTLHPERP
jgi:hypothetical protein